MNLIRKTEQRFNEIDFLKGLAIITMITSHIFYFQYQLNMIDLNFNSIWYVFLSLFAQITFITCIGINLSLSRQKNTNKKIYIQKQLKRVLTIGLFAIILSYLSYLTHGYKFIKFGILHFASLSILLMMWNASSLTVNSIIALVILILFTLKENISNFLNNHSIHPFFGFMTGLGRVSYYSMDYFPFVPWLVLIATGLILGNTIYKNYSRHFNIHKKLEHFLDNNKFSKIIRLFGKYSFFIYLIHIPILYFILKCIRTNKNIYI